MILKGVFGNLQKMQDVRPRKKYNGPGLSTFPGRFHCFVHEAFRRSIVLTASAVTDKKVRMLLSKARSRKFIKQRDRISPGTNTRRKMFTVGLSIMRATYVLL